MAAAGGEARFRMFSSSTGGGRMRQKPAHPGTRGKAETMELFARHVSSGKAAFFRAAGIEFVLGRREGPYLWDVEGEKRLIDCHCNGGVFNLGHRNPEIVAELVNSLQRFDVGNHHLISGPRRRSPGSWRISPGDLTYSVFSVGAAATTWPSKWPAFTHGRKSFR
jgi:hypothetical protein